MTDSKVTITLPERLYQRLQILAQKTNREIAEVLIASVEATLAIDEADETLPAEVGDELAAMRQLSDQALGVMVENSFPSKNKPGWYILTQALSEQALSTAEQDELTELLAEYDQAILRRAQALALLALRGHAIPDLNETLTS